MGVIQSIPYEPYDKGHKLYGLIEYIPALSRALSYRLYDIAYMTLTFIVPSAILKIGHFETGNF